MRGSARDPGRQADRDRARPGGARALQLDAPVVGGLEPIGDFVRACAEEERRIAAGWAEFWHYTGSAGTASSSSTCSRCSPASRSGLPLPAADRAPGRPLDRICAFLGVRPGCSPRCRGRTSPRTRSRPCRHRAVSLGSGRPRGGTMLPGLTDGHPATGPLERFLQQDAPPRQPLTWEERQALIPRFEHRHQAPGDHHRRELQGLAAAARRLRRHGRGQAVRPAPGQERPAARVLSAAPPERAPPVSAARFAASCAPSGPRQLVVPAVAGRRQVHDAQVAQAAAAVGRLATGRR
jgi:hypothetical protein